MAKKCSNQKCLHVNSDSSHYCVKCGKPLEKLYSFSSSPDKRYEVIAKVELDSLKNERNRLRKQINESCTIKIEDWLKENIGIIFGSTIIFSAFVFGDWLFTKCDFKHNKQIIEIKKDDISGKYGIFDNNLKAIVTPYEFDSINHRKGFDNQRLDAADERNVRKSVEICQRRRRRTGGYGAFFIRRFGIRNLLCSQTVKSVGGGYRNFKREDGSGDQKTASF